MHSLPRVRDFTVKPTIHFTFHFTWKFHREIHISHSIRRPCGLLIYFSSFAWLTCEFHVNFALTFTLISHLTFSVVYYGCMCHSLWSDIWHVHLTHPHKTHSDSRTSFHSGLCCSGGGARPASCMVRWLTLGGVLDLVAHVKSKMWNLMWNPGAEFISLWIHINFTSKCEMWNFTLEPWGGHAQHHRSLILIDRASHVSMMIPSCIIDESYTSRRSRKFVDVIDFI